MSWIKEQLEQAEKDDKFVIGMMHHGMVEHFTMQEELFKDYVVDDWEDVSKDLAEAGLNGLVPQMLAGVLIEQGMPPQDAMVEAEKLANTEVAPSITVKALLVNAMVAHYQGDERMDKQTKAIVEGMQASPDPMTQLLGNALTSLLNDPSPRDNNLTIDLKTGKVTR